MTQITDTDLRQDLSRYLDEAVETGTPVMVTRKGGKGNVVVVSEAEFSGWRATAYLLSSPKNAQRLLRSIRQADACQVTAHDLIQPRATPDA